MPQTLSEKGEWTKVSFLKDRPRSLYTIHERERERMTFTFAGNWFFFFFFFFGIWHGKPGDRRPISWGKKTNFLRFWGSKWGGFLEMI